MTGVTLTRDEIDAIRARVDDLLKFTTSLQLWLDRVLGDTNDGTAQPGD
ncbi:MAG: hypothetical protein O3C69_07040 [Chloroflexi bacterium]|nr:hypothetical protein [Chloroflexota bacterium]